MLVYVDDVHDDGLLNVAVDISHYLHFVDDRIRKNVDRFRHSMLISFLSLVDECEFLYKQKKKKIINEFSEHLGMLSMFYYSNPSDL